MIRILILLLMAAGMEARASEPINAPVSGASPSTTQPHVTAELIPERTNIQPGEPFEVALHLHSDAGWHTYWINPGDAGLATSIKWTLPPGFSAGPIEWPTPEKHVMGPLMTYGYEGDVYLLTTITPPKGNLPTHFDVKAHAEWLVCQEECIPGKADLTLALDSGMALRLPVENKDFFAEARGRLPVGNTFWDVTATYGPFAAYGNTPDKGKEALWIQLADKTSTPVPIIGSEDIYFFPEQGNVLNPQKEAGDFGTLHQKVSAFWWIIGLQQNGEKPSRLSGVLVSYSSSVQKIRAVYISSFSTDDASVLASHAENYQSNQSVAADGGHRPPLQTATAPSLGERRLPTATAFLAILAAAFVGGLILNLMPCVLPVLALKVFSLMRHAGENPRGAWRQGVAFTAGVVLSFWVLAGLLLALRAAGNELGWGFQMQSPGFVLALIFLFFLLGLNLFGVFELGSSLVGLDAKATGRFHGLTSSFLNGALATVAATPCTAPFMGSALGFAAQQPAVVSLIIFTFLALGMATPYLLLTIFPGALRFVPKPGAWMEALKQFMGFLLMGTVIFLVYVFGALVGEGQIPGLLFTLLIWALVAWIYGRWGRRYRWVRFLTLAFFLIYFISMYDLIAVSVLETGGSEGTVARSATATSDGWQAWSPEAVAAELAKGRPVFVDFTAAWCLSCKVNERVALDTDAVKKAFAEKKVALFRADWTHADARISEALREYHRDGVPLYLLYSPQQRDRPQVLPEVLTPGVVLEAVKNL